jgi:pyruvate-formate lyase
MNNSGKDWHILNSLRSEAMLRSGIAGANPAWREAQVFAYILDEMPIFHHAGDRLAGDFGWRPDDDAALASRFPPAPPVPPACDTPEARLARDFNCFGGYSPAHTCIDYAKLLNLGLDGVVDDIRKTGDGEYRQAMVNAVQTLQQLIARYAAMMETVGEAGLAQVCRHIRHRRPSSFLEALQLVWFAHLAIGISESSDASISLGRFDQYALTSYQQSLAEGCLEDELEAQFAALVDKLNRYGDAACALNIGGLDAEGIDQCNALSRLVVRVCKAKLQPAPILAVRIHPGFPQDLFDTLIDPALFAIGQPTFYGEETCRAALRERGVPETDVHRWAANSCMGLLVEGCEVSNMWGGVVNFLLPLELALNGGKPFHKELPLTLKTRPVELPDTFASLQATFLAYLGEITDFCVAASRACTEQFRRERPNPFFSAFLGRCAERGKDRLDGADYHTAIIEAFGLVNAADALYTVKTLGFERRRYRLEELTAAAKANFAGHAALLQEIRDLPKYGNGDAAVDLLAAELAAAFQRLVRRHSDSGTCFAPSFHTLNGHVGAGAKTSASLDGRLVGEPLAKNIGANAGLATAGLTALIRSAAAIDQKSFFGGQALDISIDTKLIGSDEDKHKLQALIQTYFNLGGLQIQVNGLTAETLARAITDPEKYRDLIVRIGGYSDYFNHLSLDVRKEMARRFVNGQ